MDENLHNIDDLFKKAINRHEEMPSASVWENIDKTLDKKKVISISQKYRKLKWVAAALLIFSAGMAMYTIHTRIKNKELVWQNNLNRKSAFKKEIRNKDASEVAKQSTDSATKVATDTVSANASTYEPLAVQKQPGIESSRSQASEEKEGTADASQRRQEMIKESPKKSKVPVEKNNAGKNISPVDNIENNVANSGKSLRIGNDEPENKDELLSNRKVVDDLATVGGRAKDIFQIQPPDLSFENALKNGRSGNHMLLQNDQTVAAARKMKGLRKTSFSATFFYSPDFVSSRVDTDGPRRFREDDRNEIKNKEQIKKTSSFGVLVNYNVSSRLTIQSGIAFSGLTTFIQPKTIYARADDRGYVNYRFNCSAGYSFIPSKAGALPMAGDSATALSSSNTLRYVSVPLTVKYGVSKGKLRVRPGVGIAANFLTKGKIQTEIASSAGTEKADIDHIDGLNKSYFSALVSVEAEYNLSKRIALSFTPVSRLAFSPINTGAPVKTYLNAFGLAAGLIIKL